MNDITIMTDLDYDTDYDTVNGLNPIYNGHPV